MATAYKMQVDPGISGLLGCKYEAAAAEKVSELLQRNLESHHVYFLAKGFHNHMLHHLLTVYAAGGSPEALQAAFDQDAHMQAKALELKAGVLENLQEDWSSAAKYLGKAEYYPDFLRYFQLEVEKKGWKLVLLEYLLSGEERAEDLFCRSFSSFAHSLIQLMYGLEWEQPAAIAESLAQAAIHDNYVGTFLTRVEKSANANPNNRRFLLPELLEQVHSDEKFVNSVRIGDPNEALDGVETVCPDEAIPYLSQFNIEPENLEESMAENIHTAAYMASASVFHPPDYPRYDFFLIHHLTLTPLMLLLQEASWVPEKVKLRMLEWKGRLDVLSYVARWTPPLRVESVINYVPKDVTLVGSTEELLPKFHHLADDGHVIKTARALILAQRSSKKYIDRPWIRIKDDATWLRAMYLLLDSTKYHEGFPWVRSAGWDEAWKESGYPAIIF